MNDGHDEPIFDTDLPVLSHLTYHEWHALVSGYMVGLVPHFHPHIGYYDDEKHYWRGGFIAGTLTLYGLLIALGSRLADDD